MAFGRTKIGQAMLQHAQFPNRNDDIRLIVKHARYSHKIARSLAKQWIPTLHLVPSQWSSKIFQGSGNGKSGLQGNYMLAYCLSIGTYGVTCTSLCMDTFMWISNVYECHIHAWLSTCSLASTICSYICVCVCVCARVWKVQHAAYVCVYIYIYLKNR